jgi:hypothetical protein
MIGHLGIIVLHGLANSGIRDGAMLNQLAILVPVVTHPVDIGYMRIELIVTKLEVHVLQYQQTDSHADGQAADIDHRKNLVLFQVAPGCYEIVLEHEQLFAEKDQ